MNNKDFMKTVTQGVVKTLLGATAHEVVEDALNDEKTREASVALAEMIAAGAAAGKKPTGEHTGLIAAAIVDILNRASALVEGVMEDNLNKED